MPQEAACRHISPLTPHDLRLTGFHGYPASRLHPSQHQPGRNVGKQEKDYGADLGECYPGIVQYVIVVSAQLEPLRMEAVASASTNQKENEPDA